MYKRQAETLGLPLSCAVLLPERLCAVGYAEAKLGDKPNIDKLIAWTHKQGYSICGDIYATLRIVYKKEKMCIRDRESAVLTEIVRTMGSAVLTEIVRTMESAVRMEIARITGSAVLTEIVRTMESAVRMGTARTVESAVPTATAR